MKYVMGPYWQGQLLKDIFAIEKALTDRFKSGGVITDVTEQKDWTRRVEEASFGRNTVMYGAGGYPAVMVKFPAISCKQLNSAWPDQVYPGFIVANKIKSELYIAKYKSAYIGTGADARVVSLLGLDPGNSETFDSEQTRHKQMGPGFHQITLIEQRLIMHLCKKSGFWPRGNNNFGKDGNVPSEIGIPSHHYDATRIGRTLTGSGPLSWFHDGTPFGVADVNGNVWERCGGMRLVDGEIQIIPNNDAADNTLDQSDTSTLWKAIMPDGSLVAPGTAGTLKFDSPNPMTNDGTIQNQRTPILRTALVNPPDPAWNWGDGYYDYNYSTFQSMTADTGVTVPDILKIYGLFPIDTNYGNDGIWVRNYGKRRPFAGGDANGGSLAGPAALYLGSPASSAGWNVGARLAFVYLS